ncbi:MAG: tetratricopeptide repeat protein, partial [Candidatus Electrothrix sp. MAN1_4]|nr:tetratricopeptide repeat protein [Candidatus Electrothrix sp. MAN1_4]
MSERETPTSGDAEDMQILYSQAVAAHENGDAALAIERYGEILTYFPDADLVLYNQGLALFDLERFTEAAAAFGQAVQLRQDDPDIWYNLALAQGEAVPPEVHRSATALIRKEILAQKKNGWSFRVPLIQQ